MVVFSVLTCLTTAQLTGTWQGSFIEPTTGCKCNTFTDFFDGDSWRSSNVCGTGNAPLDKCHTLTASFTANMFQVPEYGTNTNESIFNRLIWTFTSSSAVLTNNSSASPLGVNQVVDVIWRTNSQGITVIIIVW